MGKALFFDIDGTLVNFRGQMPESAKRALQQVQKNGHKIVICSGRSLCQIYPWLLDMGFDGVIAAAGAYVEYGGHAVYEHHMDEKTVALACSLLDGAHAFYSAQTKNKIVMTQDSRRRMEDRFRSMRVSEDVAEQLNINMQTDEHIVQRADIEKLNFFGSELSLAELQERLAESCDVTGMSFEAPTDDAGEISSKGINKALGMQKFIEHAGIARDDTIAFGDGPNDFDMLEYAHVGVAMGNAIDAIKERADYVTTGVDEDGIAYALQKFGLL